MATRKRIPTINLPQYTGTASTIIGNHILFISVEHDDSPSNPCKEWDGFGSIRSLSHRHIDNIHVDEAVELLDNDVDVVALSYFEHGNSIWMVKDSTAPAGVEFRWDGVKFAGVWIPDKSVRESYMGQDGLSRREWMVKQAASACETYTQFCNGEVYGYDVRLYELRTEGGEPYEEQHDYRKLTPVTQDSCWGFYGQDDYFKGEILDAVKFSLKKLKYGRRAIDAAIKEAA